MCEKLGAPLRLTNLTLPPPAPGHVIIEVLTCGVDFVATLRNAENTSVPLRAPVMGLPAFNDTALGGYAFYFESVANLEIFKRNRTMYTPRCVCVCATVCHGVPRGGLGPPRPVHCPPLLHTQLANCDNPTGPAPNAARYGGY